MKKLTKNSYGAASTNQFPHIPLIYILVDIPEVAFRIDKYGSAYSPGMIGGGAEEGNTCCFVGFIGRMNIFNARGYHGTRAAFDIDCVRLNPKKFCDSFW